MKKNIMKARGIRFEDEQWAYLEKKAGKNATPSDYVRDLVNADMAKDKAAKK